MPPVTAADRAAAFPEVHHTGHRERLNTFVLADQLEWWQGADGRRGAVWDARGWMGRDVTRLWFRTDGDLGAGTLRQARAQVFYGRAVHRFWDVLAGVRRDVRPGPSQTWAAFGIQGLAPCWFDVQATAYVGAGGRLQAEVDVEYDLLLTNRLILQPRVEAAFSSENDVERRRRPASSATEVGLRHAHASGKRVRAVPSAWCGTGRAGRQRPGAPARRTGVRRRAGCAPWPACGRGFERPPGPPTSRRGQSEVELKGARAS